MKNILFASSECVPFIKTGGLADVAGSLPKEFDKSKYDVRVVLPKYSCMKQEWKDRMEYVNHFYMNIAGQDQYVGILKTVYNDITFYFIDNETNSIYLFNGQIQSLSDKLGLRQWVSENNSNNSWDPINYGNFRSFYDKNNNDVYFTNSSTSLCYSELLGQFTSFMSYEKIPAMFNIGAEFYSIKGTQLWHNFSGDYNMFYGEFKPYSITIIANSNEPYDKIAKKLGLGTNLNDSDQEAKPRIREIVIKSANPLTLSRRPIAIKFLLLTCDNSSSLG